MKATTLMIVAVLFLIGTAAPAFALRPTDGELFLVMEVVHNYLKIITDQENLIKRHRLKVQTYGWRVETSFAENIYKKSDRMVVVMNMRVAHFDPSTNQLKFETTYVLAFHLEKVTLSDGSSGIHVSVRDFPDNPNVVYQDRDMNVSMNKLVGANSGFSLEAFELAYMIYHSFDEKTKSGWS